MTKACLGCGEEKPLESFHRANLGKDGRRSRCIECYRPYFREYYKRPERSGKNAESAKKYYDNLSKEEKRELMVKIKQRRSDDPTTMLGKSLRRGLLRHPTPEPVTLNYLLELWRNQDGCCAFSGVLMTWGKGVYLPTSISIDRIDSRKGYTADNVRLVCYAINTFKGVWTDKHMIEMAHAISLKHTDIAT